ncbi:MAG: 4-hydroxybutyrate CoA-transferase [Candidatus Binatia bacterium]|nr:MAG: 4-hydroxybutyrate CoA-transferase [Candidatus Binatia bacterium]
MEKAADWRALLGRKLVTPDEAVRHVRPGSLVRLPLGPVPLTLLEALARRKGELEGVRVLQGATAAPHPWTREPSAWHGIVDYVTDFASVLVRDAVAGRWADFLVTDYSIGSRVREGGRRDNWSADAFFALVSEPDETGTVGFGYSLWHSRSLLRSAKLRVAEVARGVLRTCGENAVALDEFDLVVESTAAPRESRSPYPALSPERVEVTETVGAYVSTLVSDGDTVQIGTGTLSSCMGGYLEGKRDLGIDSEILVASAVELVKKGVATGIHKTYHPGVATGSFIVPGADFAFCHRNPRIALYDIEWVNHLPRIASIRNLVAINQASAIDLTGQVASESIGATMYTGPGGQLVWTMGALLAPGGRAVHVLPSTARRGQVSRIVPELPGGTVVTVPRTFVDFVVTEYGIANLQGLTQRERALALVDLAHPKFRAWLRSEARRRFWP